MPGFGGCKLPKDQVDPIRIRAIDADKGMANENGSKKVRGWTKRSSSKPGVAETRQISRDRNATSTLWPRLCEVYSNKTALNDPDTRNKDNLISERVIGET